MNISNIFYFLLLIKMCTTEINDNDRLVNN